MNGDDDAFARRERAQRLGRVHGPGELQAALLGLLLTRTSRRERNVWREETRALADAPALLADVLALTPAERLPWFETYARRIAAGPIGQRREAGAAVRRMMAADGHVSPADRLHWLALRHLLGEPAGAQPGSPPRDLDSLQPERVRAVCAFCAYLSRLVPGIDDAAGAAWYARVVARWVAPSPDRPAPRPAPVDVDTLVHALRATQALPWMHKPVLLREWLNAALALSPGVALEPGAADALRLVAVLLDAPLAPELSRQFVEVPA